MGESFAGYALQKHAGRNPDIGGTVKGGKYGNFDKKYIDTLMNQDFKITKNIIISSHFFDQLNKKDIEYNDISSLEGYFSSSNIGNVFIKELSIGEKLSNVIIIMSFDYGQGDITLNFRKNEIYGIDIYDTKEKIVK